MIWNKSNVEQWEEEVTYLMFVFGEGDNTRKNFNMPLFPCFACEMTREVEGNGRTWNDAWNNILL